MIAQLHLLIRVWLISVMQQVDSVELASILLIPHVLLLVHHLLLVMMELLAPLILAQVANVPTQLQPQRVAVQLRQTVLRLATWVLTLQLALMLVALDSFVPTLPSRVFQKLAVIMDNRVVVMMVMLAPMIYARMVVVFT